MAGDGTNSNDSAARQQRLRGEANMEHTVEKYEDLQLDFNPLLYSSLERYLPEPMLDIPRELKIKYMTDIISRYCPIGQRERAQKHKAYKLSILSDYQPLHKELYKMNSTNFFVPSFIRAIRENTEESFRNIMTEPSPGIFLFEMLQPRFCELLVSEVENFQKWVHETKFSMMRPSTLNKFGAVLDDFGMESMLDKLMKLFILPISKVFFPEVGGSTLESHHGFIVEYGINRDVDLGLHVDDAEVTLNVCLGKEFSGGELFFRGTRCKNHKDIPAHHDEAYDYSHVPGRAVLHHGCHRHGARATTSGHRINLLLWCRSPVFRELMKRQKDFHSWCGECKREKRERQSRSFKAMEKELWTRLKGKESAT